MSGLCHTSTPMANVREFCLLTCTKSPLLEGTQVPCHLARHGTHSLFLLQPLVSITPVSDILCPTGPGNSHTGRSPGSLASIAGRRRAGREEKEPRSTVSGWVEAEGTYSTEPDDPGPPVGARASESGAGVRQSGAEPGSDT